MGGTHLLLWLTVVCGFVAFAVAARVSGDVHDSCGESVHVLHDSCGESVYVLGDSEDLVVNRASRQLEVTGRLIHHRGKWKGASLAVSAPGCLVGNVRVAATGFFTAEVSAPAKVSSVKGGRTPQSTHIRGMTRGNRLTTSASIRRRPTAGAWLPWQLWCVASQCSASQSQQSRVYGSSAPASDRHNTMACGSVQSMHRP